MFDPGPCVYMEKIAVGPDAAGVIDINATTTENLQAVAKAKGESVRDLTVVILDRDRHTDLIAEVRAAGARVRLISDGDVYGAIATAWPDAGVDMLFGIGGTPEGVIAAAALKCMGGEMQGRLWPRNDEERAAAVAAGYDLDRVLTTDDLVRRATTASSPPPASPTASCCGACASTTRAPRPSRSSCARESGTVRLVDARHRLDKLQQYATIDYA